MRVKVKICGITNWPDARVALDAGADLLGFNFYGPSPRYITPSDARRIIRRMPARAKSVGVFVNDEPTDVADLAALAGLDWIQLHGEESAEYAAGLARRFPVLKAFRMRRGFRMGTLAAYRPMTARGGILLDGFSARARGGTGKTFDWRMAKEAGRYGRIFLAGGLTPENAAAAVRAVEPYALDVCSGVEASPRKKDARRLRALMDAVAAANGELR